MDLLIPETEKNTVEVALQEKSKLPKRFKKIKKETFIVNLYNGRAGKEGDEVPLAPIRDIPTIVEKLREAEVKGYFRVRKNIKSERNSEFYIREVKWYLQQAAKLKLIVREPQG